MLLHKKVWKPPHNPFSIIMSNDCQVALWNKDSVSVHLLTNEKSVLNYRGRIDIETPKIAKFAADSSEPFSDNSSNKRITLRRHDEQPANDGVHGIENMSRSPTEVTHQEVIKWKWWNTSVDKHDIFSISWTPSLDGSSPCLVSMLLKNGIFLLLESSEKNSVYQTETNFKSNEMQEMNLSGLTVALNISKLYDIWCENMSINESSSNICACGWYAYRVKIHSSRDDDIDDGMTNISSSVNENEGVLLVIASQTLLTLWICKPSPFSFLNTINNHSNKPNRDQQQRQQQQPQEKSKSSLTNLGCLPIHLNRRVDSVMFVTNASSKQSSISSVSLTHQLSSVEVLLCAGSYIHKFDIYPTINDNIQEKECPYQITHSWTWLVDDNTAALTQHIHHIDAVSVTTDRYIVAVCGMDVYLSDMTQSFSHQLYPRVHASNITSLLAIHSMNISSSSSLSLSLPALSLANTTFVTSTVYGDILFWNIQAASTSPLSSSSGSTSSGVHLGQQQISSFQMQVVSEKPNSIKKYRNIGLCSDPLELVFISLSSVPPLRSSSKELQSNSNLAHYHCMFEVFISPLVLCALAADCQQYPQQQWQLPQQQMGVFTAPKLISLLQRYMTDHYSLDNSKIRRTNVISLAGLSVLILSELAKAQEKLARLVDVMIPSLTAASTKDTSVARSSSKAWIPKSINIWSQHSTALGAELSTNMLHKFIDNLIIAALILCSNERDGEEEGNNDDTVVITNTNISDLYNLNDIESKSFPIRSPLLLPSNVLMNTIQSVTEQGWAIISQIPTDDARRRKKLQLWQYLCHILSIPLERSLITIAKTTSTSPFHHFTPTHAKLRQLTMYCILFTHIVNSVNRLHQLSLNISSTPLNLASVNSPTKSIVSSAGHDTEVLSSPAAVVMTTDGRREKSQSKKQKAQTQAHVQESVTANDPVVISSTSGKDGSACHTEGVLSAEEIHSLRCMQVFILQCNHICGTNDNITTKAKVTLQLIAEILNHSNSSRRAVTSVTDKNAMYITNQSASSNDHHAATNTLLFDACFVCHTGQVPFHRQTDDSTSACVNDNSGDNVANNAADLSTFLQPRCTQCNTLHDRCCLSFRLVSIDLADDNDHDSIKNSVLKCLCCRSVYLKRHHEIYDTADFSNARVAYGWLGASELNGMCLFCSVLMSKAI